MIRISGFAGLVPAELYTSKMKIIIRGCMSMIKESVWTIGDVNPKCPFKGTLQHKHMLVLNHVYAGIY